VAVTNMSPICHQYFTFRPRPICPAHVGPGRSFFARSQQGASGEYCALLRWERQGQNRRDCRFRHSSPVARRRPAWGNLRVVRGRLAVVGAASCGACVRLTLLPCCFLTLLPCMVSRAGAVRPVRHCRARPVGAVRTVWRAPGCPGDKPDNFT
jgi:hypothetical protein